MYGACVLQVFALDGLFAGSLGTISVMCIQQGTRLSWL